MFYTPTSTLKRKLHHAWAFGALIALSPSLQMPAHAATYTTLHDFYANPSGSAADGGLVRGSDGTMYGTTGAGGVYGAGTIFSLSADGSFHTLYSFKNTGDPVKINQGMAFGPDGCLYGVSNFGGALNAGALFRFNPATKIFTVLHSFTQGYGAFFAPPIVLADGTVLGSLLDAGNSAALIYRWTQADGYTVVQNYSAALCDGKDGWIYGQGHDMLFKMNSAGKVVKLRDTTSAEGSSYTFALALGPDNMLWGVSHFGGSNASKGIVYRVAKTGQRFTIVHTNSDTDEYASKAPISVGADNRLYACYGKRIFSVGADGQYRTILDDISGGQYSAPVF